MTHIWVEKGSGDALNKISVGWHVSYNGYIYDFLTKLNNFKLCFKFEQNFKYF